ncbi:DUF6445 family protein [Gilvimarinus agarilyticus]|uniref:DUF6445 family protein n=1 Tax=Gilvimarinus agarilyticus TaxID=679259 RepID=UPI000695EC73|nr:DUF6445 family protein [Gilvimarinus agarilyticus]
MSSMHKPTPELSANHRAHIECRHIGRERYPLLVIDDFLTAPEQLVELASRAEFKPTQGLFPGHRAPVPRAYTDALEHALPPLLADVFGTRPGDIKRVESSYSLVTQPPTSLKPLQRIPHFDSRDTRELASIYFLCNRLSKRYGGTGFYRHRRTGFESITDERFSRYMAALEQDAQQAGLPAADYIRGDTAAFEKIAEVPARYNRLVIYPCTVLHSGLIGADFDYSQNPTQARLSINSFLVNG